MNIKEQNFLESSEPVTTNKPALMFWSRLIQTGAAVVLALSAVLLLAPSTGISIFNFVYYQTFSSTGLESNSPYIQFAHGIIGAVLAGWMIGIIILARTPFIAGERYAWNTITFSLAGWFLIDTGFSLFHAIWGNLFLNLAIALLFGIPLLATHKYFTLKK